MKKAIKIITALLAAAAAVYLIAQYGDTIVAFAKKLMNKCPCMKKNETAPAEPEAEEAPAVVKTAPAAEVTEKEPVAEEAAPVAEINEPVANEEDFEA